MMICKEGCSEASFEDFESWLTTDARDFCVPHFEKEADDLLNSEMFKNMQAKNDELKVLLTQAREELKTAKELHANKIKNLEDQKLDLECELEECKDEVMVCYILYLLLLLLLLLLSRIFWGCKIKLLCLGIFGRALASSANRGNQQARNRAGPSHKQCGG